MEIPWFIVVCTWCISLSLVGLYLLKRMQQKNIEHFFSSTSNTSTPNTTAEDTVSKQIQARKKRLRKKMRTMLKSCGKSHEGLEPLHQRVCVYNNYLQLQAPSARSAIDDKIIKKRGYCQNNAFILNDPSHRDYELCTLSFLTNRDNKGKLLHMCKQSAYAIDDCMLSVMT